MAKQRFMWKSSAAKIFNHDRRGTRVHKRKGLDSIFASAWKCKDKSMIYIYNLMPKSHSSPVYSWIQWSYYISYTSLYFYESKLIKRVIIKKSKHGLIAIILWAQFLPCSWPCCPTCYLYMQAKMQLQNSTYNDRNAIFGTMILRRKCTQNSLGVKKVLVTSENPPKLPMLCFCRI